MVLVVYNPYENNAEGWKSKTTVTNFTDKIVEIISTIFDKEGRSVEIKVGEVLANDYIDYSSSDISSALLTSNDTNAKDIYNSINSGEPFYTKTVYRYKGESSYVDNQNDIVVTSQQESITGNRNVRLVNYDKNSPKPTSNSGEFQIGALANGDTTTPNSFIKVVNMGSNSNQEIGFALLIPYTYNNKTYYYEHNAYLKGGKIKLYPSDEGYTHLEYYHLTNLLPGYSSLKTNMPIKIKAYDNFGDIKVFAADRDDGSKRPRIHFINAVVN